MAAGPQAALLPDGRRLHLNHGPIDLVIEAFGAEREVTRAYEQAVERFSDILETLVAELPELRRPVGDMPHVFAGPVARRMAAAVWWHRGVRVTPMAAVAGAVADEMLAALTAGRRLDRAYVNDGGDIALYLAPGAGFEVGLAARPARAGLDGSFTVTAKMPLRGVATSGQGGRSFSLGIADAVTVLAADAAAADVAATLIANAVDLDHPAIERRPARALDPDSDLGDLPVTVAVGALDEEAVMTALTGGEAAARSMLSAGLIFGAVLALNGQFRVVGDALARALPAAA
ncbi:MAG: UPF0280 family protein [Rhodospirillales bacterium]|nr:UPF0280 family protein [Rhodospirillales bacterium]MDH3911538.1 UPF0280 family protein [Rhodospirillales bacterium]